MLKCQTSKNLHDSPGTKMIQGTKLQMLEIGTFVLPASSAHCTRAQDVSYEAGHTRAEESYIEAQELGVQRVCSPA